MIVCTHEEAATKNCCMMVKKCCGMQCMAWNELGANGFCGAIPQPEIMQKAQESFGGMPIPRELIVAEITTGTIPQNAVITTSGLQPYEEHPQSANQAANIAQMTIHKPKHTGVK